MSAKRGGTLDWFVQKKRKNVDGSSTSLPSQPQASTSLPSKSSTDLPFKEKECPFNVKSLLHDPGLRTSILDYHPNLQDEIRLEYISRGLCRPAHDFPQTNFGGKMRRFRYEWYQKYSWLEYSVSKDSAFCFVCYLFNDKEFKGMGGDAFVRNGFKGWNRPVGFTKHVGKVNSVHNQAREKYESLMKPKTSIQNLFDKQSAKSRRKYRTRLLASLHCIRLLLHQGLSTRGKKEGLVSIKRGNFLELLAWLAKHNEDINKVVLEMAPKNHKLTSPWIQRDLINCCAKETTKIIIKELGEDYFSILADESADVSHKEQLSLCLRYVDKKGAVIERFLGILHVKDTACVRYI